MNSNLIDFSKFIPHEKETIDSEAAKKYFISEVLPYVSIASLQRLITGNASDNTQVVRLEIMRMFVESELMKPTTTNMNSLKKFFSQP
ncbi:hypothetical protein [Pelosinus sp. sgz500959]|uniref:hypothetical protein n=1 Tax=Pelosinus sp. sgz500959 TaxID=3242472 RepID=UPI00366E3055